MKKIIILLAVASIAAASCKKETYCYSCVGVWTGNDTIMCGKTQSDIDKLMKDEIMRGCVKN